MRLDTKFDLGQRVVAIERRSERVLVPCGFCSDSGRVTGADGTSRTCPKCFGASRYEHLPQAWTVVGVMTVGQVRVEVTDSLGTDDGEVFDNFAPQGGREDQYMLVETGIGSGRLWDEADVFATADEAKSACDERNATVPA